MLSAGCHNAKDIFFAYYISQCINFAVAAILMRPCPVKSIIILVINIVAAYMFHPVLELRGKTGKCHPPQTWQASVLPDMHYPIVASSRRKAE